MKIPSNVIQFYDLDCWARMPNVINASDEHYVWLQMALIEETTNDNIGRAA